MVYRFAVMPQLVRVFVILVGVGVGVGLQRSSASAQTPTVSEPLRVRIEHLRDQQAPPIRGARLMQREAVAAFFEARNFTPAWQGAAIDQIVDAIREIDRDGLTPADYHLAAIDALRGTPPASGRPTTAAASAAPSPAPSPVDPADREADLQILLTDALAALVDHVRYGKVKPVSLDRRWNVDPRAGAPPLETTLEEIAASPSVFASVESLKPSHFIYIGLKRALASHRALASSGGWTAIPAGATLKPGETNARVALVRKRLMVTGELDAPLRGESAVPAGMASAGAAAAVPASIDMYDDELQHAVQKFQESHRLTADGAIGRATLDAMNLSAEARVNQIRVNLERARWVVGGLSNTFVLVNLPAFKVYLIRNSTNVWETRVQVGKAGRQTPAFRADMRYLVFNPDWTVPPTILAKDVLAEMKKGKNAIAKKKLTILDRQGREVNADSIDWAAATTGNFRYTLRQPPGADNALGRVKFIFPNEHSIFLHDTPSRDLFSADERTFSSGCIRVQNPLDLAAQLLDGQADWTRDKIQEAVDDGETQTVILKTPLPVLIVYWTVSVGATGDLRYAKDVYDLDAPVLRALNGGSAAPTPAGAAAAKVASARP